MINFLSKIGRALLDFLQLLGRVVIFIVNVLIIPARKNFYFRAIGKNIIEIGYYSLPVVGITAIFTGAVLAIQSYVGFARFSAESAIATVVVLSITRELGPVLAGLMVAGRVGSSIAAELGTMKVTEQLDALVTLSTSPYKFLAKPKIIAAVIVLPCLVLVADIIGVFGGYLVSVHVLDFNYALYLDNTIKYLHASDVNSGLIKAAIFGFIISVMGCYHGFNSKVGAQGVGAATINAVVSSSILILLFDYVITRLLFSN